MFSSFSNGDWATALLNWLTYLVGRGWFAYTIVIIICIFLVFPLLGDLMSFIRSLVFGRVKNNARIVSSSGAVWGNSHDAESALSLMGYQNVGSRVRSEDWAQIDDSGVETGERATLEFYERI